MVTTLLKTSLREIRQSLGRYLAILAIVGLGVGFFAGLRTCQPSMAATGIAYLERQRLYDFRLLSTLGFTEEDVTYFAALEEIDTACGAVYADFLTENEIGEEIVLRAHSLSESVNIPQLTAGRMPQAPDECLADARTFSEEDLGRVLSVSSHNNEDTRELLHCGKYTVVGTAISPYYLNYQRGTSSIGSGTVSGFVYIPEAGFDFEAYYEIFLTLTDHFDAYSDEYTEQIDRLKPVIEAALEDRAGLRYTTIYDDAMAEIRDAEQDIADGWDEYRSERADAENELNDAYQELTDGEQEYADGLKDYEQGRRDYEDGRKEYADGQRKAADAEQEIADAERELADAEQELADAEQELADAGQELSDARQELADARQELNDGWIEYEQGKLDAQRELADAHQKLLDGEQEYRDGEEEYADGLRQLADAEQELADGEQKLLDGEQELSDGERELEDARDQLRDALRELDDAEAQITAAKKQLEEGEASYQQVKQLYDSTEQLAQGIGASMGMSMDAGTLIRYLTSNMSPELNAAVDMALQGSGSSVAELAAGWTAAESQLGAPLTSETIAGLRSTLDQAQREYQSGVDQYNDGYAQYRDGLSDYRDGEAQLEDARKELKDGWAELEDGRRELEDARAELEDARKKLDDARIELDDGWREYYSGAEEAQEELDKAYRDLTDGEDEYADGLKKYEDGVRDYEDGVQEYKDGVQKYEDGKRELEEGRQELADAWKELEDARKKLADARDELDRAPGELADARQELDDGWQEYNDGREEADREFADAEEELTDAEQKLADAYEDLKDLKHASTYTLTRNENIGYACFDNDTSIIAAISVVFPVFFFLVAALVCMTTMTRMVDEQRTQIGVLKALGYSNGQIMGKYLFYSGSAAFTGSTLGFFAGSYGLPWVIWEIYGIIYGFAPLTHVFLPGLMVLSFAAALLCSMGATWLACRMELARQAAELLRPKTPRAGKRVFLEYITPLWRRLSFLHKVSVRNVLRYRSRLVMMILGIGGCTALLVTGFGIRDSIQHVADYQFDEIELYDYAVSFQDPQTPQSAEEFLTRTGWDLEDGLLVYSGSIDILVGDASKSIYMTVADNTDRFVSLHSGDTPIPYPGPGEAVLNVSLAQNMGISAGDVVRLRDEEYGTIEVTVSGIMDNYVQNYVYLSRECYEQQFDEPLEYNTLYVLGHADADPYEEGAVLLEDGDVSNVSIIQATRDQVDSMLSRLDYIVVVVVGCAAALAFIVLYNLTNINITERVREIATIKVLGFYRNEVASYVFREINILSILGSFAGLLMGKALHGFVMSQIQIDAMYFSSRITVLSYLLSLLMTLLFTFGISFGMRPKLHKIDMAESLKSIE